ncbi:hypothetical protein Taro_034307, partial [Colocasia esculenta]|nr:hypothetical protein [Colocasia esculenta]
LRVVFTSFSASRVAKGIYAEGSLSAGCQSILETIFSPMLDHIDGQGTLADHKTEGYWLAAGIFGNINSNKEQPDLPHLVPDDSDDGSCTSSGYQPCSATDYCIPDSSDLLEFNGSMTLPDALTGSCSDYNSADCDMMIDLPERYMILPFVERTRQGCHVKYEDSVEEAAVNTDDSCLYLAIHQLKSSDEDIGSCSWDIEDLGSFDPQIFIKNLPDLPEAVSSLWPMLLPKETRKRKSITLVLDLDETLVHSTLEHCADADFTFPVFFNMKEHTVYVRRRPYLHVFLERVAQLFEIVIFTASQSIYAEQLLDILDPGKKLISQRIYRESCIFSEGSYTKDLTILGVDLAKVVIIDNSPQVIFP